MNQLFFPALHFAALIAFLTYKMSPAFGDFIRSRHLIITEGLSKSEAQAKLAQDRRKEVELKVSRLGAQKEELVNEWKKREVEQIALVRESSKKVLGQMKLDAERNQKSLEEQFRGDTLKSVGRMILARAVDKITKSMSVEKNQKLNEDFIRQIAGAADRGVSVQGAQRT